MILACQLLMLVSIAVTDKRDKSIIYSRLAMQILLYCLFLVFYNMYYWFNDNIIAIFGGLITITTLTQTFNLFIFFISIIILQLTSFYPRKIVLSDRLNDVLDYNIYYITKPIKYFYYFISKTLFVVETNNNNVNKFIVNMNSNDYYTTVIKCMKIAKSKLDIIGKMGQQFIIIEYSLIVLFVIIGALFLISVNDLVSFFLCLELQSYALYLLCTVYRNSELSTSAGLTYFLLGGLSSCFIVLATAILYANSGITNLDSFYTLTSVSNIMSEFSNNLIYVNKAIDYNIALVILSVGLLFKISAAPFHFWSPDVYDAIPTIVTTFVAIVTKISIFIFILQLLHYTNNFLYPFYFNWKTSLLLSSFLSLIIGTVLGLTQSRIKRLFAYSTISHLGFLLLALAINSIESTQAFIFYLLQYSISNLNAFMILITIGFSLFIYSNNNTIKGAYKNNQENYILDRNNSPIQLISELKGYYSINSFLALCLSITFFSFTGLPPLIGFFAKQMVLSAAIDSGYIFISLVAILTSVISAVYYLNLIKNVYFDKCIYIENRELTENLLLTKIFKLNFFNKYITSYASNYKNKSTIFESKNVIIYLSSYFTFTVSCISCFLIFFFIDNKQLSSLTNILALTIFNTP